MSIQHETSKSKKYKHLVYVEFLELLCRAAPYIPQNDYLYHDKPHTPIHVKVLNLLKIIFDYRSKEGLAFDQEILFEPKEDSESENESGNVTLSPASIETNHD